MTRMSTGYQVRATPLRPSLAICTHGLTIVGMLDEDGPLSKYLHDNGSEDDVEDRTGEADLKDDPIYNLDLSVRLLIPSLCV